MSAPDATPAADPARAAEAVMVNRRTRQRQVLLFSGIVAAILLVSYILSGTDPLSTPAGTGGAPRPEVVDIVTAGRALEDADLWRGQAEAELLMLRKDNEELRKAVDNLAASLEQVALTGSSWGRDNDLPEWEDLPPGPDPEPGPDPLPPPQPAAPVATREVAPASRGMQVLAFSDDTGAGGPTPGDPAAAGDDGHDGARGGNADKKPRLPHHRDRIPAGSFVPATLLGSLDAPTGQSGPANPHPVLLRIDGRAWLPNRFRRDIRECLVTAAGYGDISSERAYIRTERLSCVTRGGLVVDLPVRGHVAGEDGKTGVRGNLVSRQGRLLARSLFSGVVAGIGGAFHDRHSEIRALDTVGGDSATVRSYPRGLEFEAGVASGLAGSLDRLSEYYLALADRMHPIIEVSAGRRVDIVFQEGVDLPELDDTGGAARRDAPRDPLEARYGRHGSPGSFRP